MAKTPHFDGLASVILYRLGDRYVQNSATDLADIEAIAQQLRDLWNARGAADFAAVDEVPHTNEWAVECAIRDLDVVSRASVRD